MCEPGAAGRAKIGDAALRRQAGAGQDDEAAGATDMQGERVGRRLDRVGRRHLGIRIHAELSRSLVILDPSPPRLRVSIRLYAPDDHDHPHLREFARHHAGRALREHVKARPDRRTLRARKPRARLRHGRCAERARPQARHRLRLQELVRQGEPHLARGAARARPRQGAHDLRRHPQKARSARSHRRARARPMRGRRRSRRHPANPGLPLPSDGSPWSPRRGPGASSTSRRGSSSPPGT